LTQDDIGMVLVWMDVSIDTRWHWAGPSMAGCLIATRGQWDVPMWRDVLIATRWHRDGPSVHRCFD
jgi:hypothetical protein